MKDNVEFVKKWGNFEEQYAETEKNYNETSFQILNYTSQCFELKIIVHFENKENKNQLIKENQSIKENQVVGEKF